MKSSEIISEIEEIVKSQTGGIYSKWMIGRTNNLEDSKTQRGEPNRWREWDTNSVDDAEKAESYFVDKGMRQDSKSHSGADFVYVFYIGSPQEKI
jgi:hypothetical protein